MPLAVATTAATVDACCSPSLNRLVGMEGSLIALLEGGIECVQVLLGAPASLALGAEVSCMVQAQLRPLAVRCSRRDHLALSLALSLLLSLEGKDGLTGGQGDTKRIPRGQVLDGSEP